MSNKLITLVYSRRFGSAARKAVMLKLADVARDDGSSIYPSIDRIALETEISDRWVKKTLKQFRAEGLLQVVETGGGRRKATKYQMDLVTVEGLPMSYPAPDAGYSDDPPAENGALNAPFHSASEEQNGELSSPFNAGKGELSSENSELSSPEPLGTLNYSKSADRSETPPEPEQSPPARGAIAPTSKLVWDEAIALLSPYFPESRYRSLIGRWAKRTRLGDHPDALYSVIMAAKRAGTADPVSYIEAALAKSHPPPPDPSKLSETEWGFRIKAAIHHKQWDRDWGPKPGEPKCHVPPSLVTPQLLTAVGSENHRDAA